MSTDGTAADRGGAGPRPQRNLVTRADGKLVNVSQKIGQLFVCKDG